MLGGREHGHIHSNFRNDANSGIGLDTRHRHNKVELRKILFRKRKNKRFQVGFANIKAVDVGPDNAELFSLFDTQFSVHGSKDFLVGGFHASGTKSGNIGDSRGWILQEARSDCGSRVSEYVRKHVIQFDIGNSQTVLSTVLFSGCKTREFLAVTN